MLSVPSSPVALKCRPGGEYSCRQTVSMSKGEKVQERGGVLSDEDLL